MTTEPKTTEAPIVGSYKCHLIPKWIDAPDRGGRFAYDRIAAEDDDGSVNLAQMRPDEFVTFPGLIYRRIP